MIFEYESYSSFMNLLLLYLCYCYPLVNRYLRLRLLDVGLDPPLDESDVVGLNGPTSSTSMSSSSEQSPASSSSHESLVSSSDVRSPAPLPFLMSVPANASTENLCKEEVVDPVVGPPFKPVEERWWWWSFLSDEWPWCKMPFCCCWIWWWRSLSRNNSTKDDVSHEWGSEWKERKKE